MSIVFGLECLATSTGLVILELVLQPSLMLNSKLLLLLDLDVGAVDLLPGSWITVRSGRHCFWTLMLGCWTCHLEGDPAAQAHVVASGLG